MIGTGVWVTVSSQNCYPKLVRLSESSAGPPLLQRSYWRDVAIQLPSSIAAGNQPVVASVAGFLSGEGVNLFIAH